MLSAAKIVMALSVVWAAVALTVQVYQAWGGGRRDYSRRAGSPGRGILYNFTVAMTPGHKETTSRHPLAFLMGLVMHLGVTLALLGVVLLLVKPTAGLALLRWGRPLVVLGLLAGIFLLVRRPVVKNLRAMSVPDDYLAVLATCGLLALASVGAIGSNYQITVLLYSALLFLYLPLGKLRHAVFFFVVRGDYGRRLGYRGVYPPATGRMEQPDGRIAE